jgi:hypothetical protein
MKPLIFFPLEFFRFKTRIRLLDENNGHPLGGIPITLTAELSDGDPTLRFVVGTLVTDHVGYVSFSLKRFASLTPAFPPNLNTDRITSLRIDAPGVGIKDLDLTQTIFSGDMSKLKIEGPLRPIDYLVLFANLASNRFGNLAGMDGAVGNNYFDTAFIVKGSRQKAEGDCLCDRAIKGMRSIEDDDDLDRIISPGSFYVQDPILVGSGACQVPTPASTPPKDIRLFHVVLNGSDPFKETPERDIILNGAAVPGTASKTKRAKVARYLQRWTPLGYSLGDIRYSLPLAPGESVNLAVIEWSREDRITRRDSAYSAESLDHKQRRARDIEETVAAAVSEEQGGGSFMAGLSGAASATVPISGVPVNLALGTALGGGVTHTWGERDISGETAQYIRDRLSQASEMQRSLNSTTVIQVDQKEKNTLSSRTVANHNRGHAMTIQYFEVLRNYRVDLYKLNELSAVLVPFIPFVFDDAVALKWEHLLKPALLNPDLAPGFDALRLKQHGATLLDAPATSNSPATTTQPTTSTNYWSGTSDRAISPVKNSEISNYDNTGFMIAANSQVHVSESVDSGWIAYGIGLDYGAGGGGAIPAGDKAKWKDGDAPKYSLVAKIGSNTYPVGASRTFTALNEGLLEFFVNDEIGRYNDNWAIPKGGEPAFPLPNYNPVRGLRFKVTVTRVTSPTQGTTVTPSQDLQEANPATRKALNSFRADALVAHLKSNSGYYNRVVWLGMDRTELELILGAALSALPGAFEALYATPVAIWRNYLAFVNGAPELEASPSTKPLTSQVVALPSRGVLAEAQLGSCVATEKRDASLIQEWTLRSDDRAPNLDQLVPGPKGQQPNFPGLVQLGAPVISIQPFPEAPAPTALAAALQVLGKGDIFRNMSAQAEVGSLLEKLADGTFKSLEEAVSAAKKAKEKVDKAEKDASDELEPSRVSATDLADRFSLLPEIKTFAKDVGLDPDEYKQFAMDQMYGTQPTKRPPAPTGKQTPIPQAKPDEVQIAIRVRDAWDRPADADIQCWLTDDSSGPMNVMHTGIRRNANSSSAMVLGLLPPLKGLTKGVMDLSVQMLSSSYENMSSDVVDLNAGGIPYSFPSGTRFATFYARQEYEEVKVTVNAGESLANKVASELAGKVAAGAEIKVVEASLEVSGSRNWEDEYSRTQTVTKEFVLRVPKPQIKVTQVTP